MAMTTPPDPHAGLADTGPVDVAGPAGTDVVGPADAPADHGKAAGGLTRRIDQARSVANEQVDRVERRFPRVSIIDVAHRKYRRLNGPVLAGHLAFRTFLFLLPMAVFIVAIGGFASAAGVDLHTEVGSRLQLGNALSDTVSTSADSARDGRFALGLSASLGLILGALGVVSALHFAFAQVWELPIAKIPGRGRLLLKFAGIVVLLGLVVLISAAVRRSGPVWGLGAFTLAAVLATGAFLGISMMLPHRSDGWYWLVPGAVLGTAGLIGLHVVAVYYLPGKVAKASALYGSLGVAVSALFFLFLLSTVIIASAFVNAAWWDYHRPDDLDTYDAGVGSRSRVGVRGSGR